MDCTTQLISSNQVIEVGLRKPKCFDFEGNTLNDWLKELSERLCCIEGTQDSVKDLTVASTWTIIKQPKILQKGKVFYLSGCVQGGNITSTICTLPFEVPERMIVPIAHEFTGTTYRVFLKIDTDRSVKLYFTGTAPGGASSKLYLDGVSFFFE